MVELSYNTNHHSSIKMTPFKAVYGLDATTIHDYQPGTNKNVSIDTSLQEHKRLLAALKDNLQEVRLKMVTQANKKRITKEFQIDEWVYLHLQP